ncbi:MAG: TonB-dependent receptor [Dysgonamonadaceae bacterium]
MKNIVIFIMLMLLTVGVSAQITIKGVVTTTTQEPLIGVSVTELGNPTNSAMTGLTGSFTLKVQNNKSKIIVTYIGFTSQTIPVSPSMKIVMAEADNILGEVEVVTMGFGTKSRISNVAAISQTSGAVIRQSPAVTLQSAMAGRLPGLFQVQGSGQPGSDGGEVFIRGVATYANKASTSPLILIDDVESSMSTFSALSPNEVESISVLKDAGSTAIFGVKGANGVILVTTRRGNKGPAKITFRADVGLQQPTYKNKFLNSYESLKLLKEMYTNDEDYSTINANERLFSDEALEHFRLGDKPYEYPNVDWYKLMFRDLSLQQKYSMDIQGGTDKVNYFISLGYVDQGGIFKTIEKTAGDFNNNYYLRRYNLRSNFDFKITKDFLLKINANAILSEINEPNLPTPGESGDYSIFRRILGGKNTPWNFPAYNPDGSFGGYTGNTVNPLALLAQGGYNRKFDNNVNGNITGEYNLDAITKGLKTRGVLALTNTWGFKRSLTRSNFLTYQYYADTNQYVPITYGSLDQIWALPQMTSKSTDISPFLKINSRIDLIYNRKFGGHSFGGLVLGNWYTSRTGKDTPENTISLSSRLSYDYNSRYIVELSGAYNGSDRFAKNNRFDFFPAVSLGWNLAEEPYLKATAERFRVDMFKLRGSYGVSGSDDIGDVYGYLETYEPSLNYFFGENPNKVNDMVLKSIANPNVRWETEKKFNIGFDMRMFNNRLGATLDYFYNKREDILSTRNSIVYYAGYLPSVLPKMNIGKTTNQGFDGEVFWSDKVNKFSYSLKGTFGYSKNKIVDMDEAPSEYLLSMQTGRPIGAIFGYIADGFYNTQDEINNGAYEALRSVKIGDVRYKDISGPNGVPDGIIDEYDRKEIGNSRPNFNYGLSVGFSYKNIDFSTLFQGATGAYLSCEQMLRIGSTLGRPMPLHQKRWTHYDSSGSKVTDAAQLAEMNKNAKFPILSDANGHNQAGSTFWLRSASYLRWKTLEIGYNIPKNVSKKVGVSSIRIYGSGQNLLTFSDLSDYQVDPESSRVSSAGSTTAGNTMGPIDTYPQQRIYNFGCQIVF